MKTLIASAILASVVISGTAQADNSLSNLTYEESANIYSEVTHQSSTPENILSYGDNANSSSVWSTEYEQYVNPGDFQQADVASAESVDQYLGSNPPAAGQSNGETFIYNETAGEYHLQ